MKFNAERLTLATFSVLLLVLLLKWLIDPSGHSVKTVLKSETKQAAQDKTLAAEDVVGIYNYWELNYQLRLKSDGSCEFYTADSNQPYMGSWRINGSQLVIAIPDYIEDELIFRVSLDGLYNDQGKLVWEKAGRRN